MRTADVEDVNLVPLAMVMAVQFTGVIVEPDRDVVDPQIFYPITKPVLRLPVTPDELARAGCLTAPRSELFKGPTRRRVGDSPSGL
jgi:hypothetical protein